MGIRRNPTEPERNETTERLGTVTQTTLRDLLWAGAIATLTALSPFTASSPVLQAIGAGAAGGLVVASRLWLRRRGGELPESGPAPAQLSVPLSVWLCLVLFAVVMAPTGRWMFQMWTASIWENGHSVFVPLIILYFAHRNLLRSDRRSGEEERGGEESSAWGLPLVVLGLALLILDTAIRSRYLSSVGLLVCLPGLSLLFLGMRRTRKILFPLFLCIFLLPIPFAFGDQILLRSATAHGVEPVVRLLGYTVTREATVLLFPTFTIDISDACSGFSALYASAFVAVVLATHCDTKWRGAVLLLSVWPIAVAANVLRATGLIALIDIYGREILETRVHGASGAATFVIALGILYFVAGRRTIRAVLS